MKYILTVYIDNLDDATVVLDQLNEAKNQAKGEVDWDAEWEQVIEYDGEGTCDKSQDLHPENKDCINWKNAQNAKPRTA